MSIFQLCYRGFESYKLLGNCLFSSPLYNITLSTIVNKLQWKLPLSHSRSARLSILPARSGTVAIAQYLYDKKLIKHDSLYNSYDTHLCPWNSTDVFRWSAVGSDGCDSEKIASAMVSLATRSEKNENKLLCQQIVDLGETFGIGLKCVSCPAVSKTFCWGFLWILKNMFFVSVCFLIQSCQISPVWQRKVTIKKFDIFR